MKFFPLITGFAMLITSVCSASEIQATECEGAITPIGDAGISLCQEAAYVGRKHRREWTRWSYSIKGQNVAAVKSVTYKLPPKWFPEQYCNVRTDSSDGFLFGMTGWGTVPTRITVLLTTGQEFYLASQVQFSPVKGQSYSEVVGSKSSANVPAAFKSLENPRRIGYVSEHFACSN